MNIALIKRWKISETLLKRAHEALPRLNSESERGAALEKEFTEYLQHNEHELALDALEELGGLTAPRGGFWKDLIRAAENMELTHRIPRFQQKFNEAIARLSKS